AGAYNDYMQEANEVIPYLEQLAYQKYQDELNRDLNLYEMEEKEKKEKANEDALVYEWTEKGDITENEEIFLRNQGYWFDENGMLVGPDGNRYATKGGVITDIEADYRAGDTLSPEDILKIENSGQGYKYQNGYLYKNGVLIPRDYMPYNEIQIALDDFASNTWYGMSPENQQILRSHGFVLDASSGNITDGKEYYAPNNGTATDNLLWKYIAGYQFTPDEMLFMNNQPGYSWSEDGKLLLDGEEIKKMTEADKSKKLANGEIPSDLAAAWSEIVDKRGTNKSLSASVYKVLGDYGFIRSNGQWIHQETGQTLDSFFGDAPSVTNPGGGTQGGTTSGTSTGGRTRYTKTPPQQESVVETPLKTPPAGGVFPPPAPKTAQDAYNDAVGMMARGDTAIAKSIIENAVNSGTMTEAQGKAFFKEYVDRYTK
ncbi:MAG: hypothetical protein U0M60_20955, partial [Clostridia bacterium]|nr:hypothetical protein [Clostridia bacterium]